MHIGNALYSADSGVGQLPGYGRSGMPVIRFGAIPLIGEGFLTAETGLVVGAEVAAMEEAAEEP